MFEVIITQEKKLVEKAQVLRHRVFFGREGKDNDPFDRFCEHLIVVDSRVERVIGTYRLLLRSVAEKHRGFYAETEFDLTNIKKNCKGELLEIGRACVDRKYRARKVINLMWEKIISFVRRKNIRYIFGCSSIHSPTPQKVGKIYSFFKEGYFSSSEYRVYPLKNKRYPYKSNMKFAKKEINSLLPSLIRGYLKMGALVAGEPVWDKKFNTADFFMIADTSNPLFPLNR